MKFRGVALVFVASCASGGTPFTPPVPADDDDQPDAPPTPDAHEEVFPDAPPDAMVLPPDAPPIDACVPQQQEKLANPALDLAPNGTGWVEVPIQNLPGGPYPIITADGLAAVSAPNKAWLGGAAGEDASPVAATLTDQLYQDITFPADATNFIVSGMFASGGIEDTDAIYDTFTLDITETNGTPIENVMVADNRVLMGTFTAFSKTLTSNLAGRTVRLRATSTNDIINHTNFFLDTLSFKATFCP